MAWLARPYQTGDEHGILDLRKAVFGQVDPVRTRLSTWRWQFKDKPEGSGFIWLAEDQGKIVGQYAAIPVRMLVNGTEVLCGYSCDTMVHPAYQKQGIFSRLALQVYEDMEARHNITTVWGFPNDNSMPGFTTKLGWKRVKDLLARVTLPCPGALFGSAENREANLYLESDRQVLRIKEFDQNFDDLWQRHRPESGIIQVRDSSYLQWRYLGVPDFQYEPFGIYRDGKLQRYVVLRFQKVSGVPVCILADCFPLPGPGKMRKLTNAVRAYAAKRGCTVVVALLSQEVKNTSFYAVPKVIAPKVFCLAGRFSEGDRNVWLKGSGWRLALGDTDVV